MANQRVNDVSMFHQFRTSSKFLRATAARMHLLLNAFVTFAVSAQQVLVAEGFVTDIALERLAEMDIMKMSQHRSAICKGVFAIRLLTRDLPEKVFFN